MLEHFNIWLNTFNIWLYISSILTNGLSNPYFTLCIPLLRINIPVLLASLPVVTRLSLPNSGNTPVTQAYTSSQTRSCWLTGNATNMWLYTCRTAVSYSRYDSGRITIERRRTLTTILVIFAVGSMIIRMPLPSIRNSNDVMTLLLCCWMMTANRWECVVSPLVSSKPYLPVRLTMPRHASLASNRIERE